MLLHRVQVFQNKVLNPFLFSLLIMENIFPYFNEWVHRACVSQLSGSQRGRSKMHRFGHRTRPMYMNNKSAFVREERERSVCVCASCVVHFLSVFFFFSNAVVSRAKSWRARRDVFVAAVCASYRRHLQQGRQLTKSTKY